MTARKRKKLAPVVRIDSVRNARAEAKRISDRQWVDAEIAAHRAEMAAQPIAKVLPFRPRAS